ncbi:hypothetical protein LFT44_15440 [Arthrobacter sp. FW306-05-C]|uniref:hypothetical protein n=1 Tax=unclassified Arthrobacter TaxID=235627 RepID=UPI001F26C88A|nr:hypothetical protein [Arthrobacter sp. FW306-05-C]UKA65886.1 hypothetical protein LFT44_15440 [Arthrobacter sp. FW306-05-C]
MSAPLRFPRAMAVTTAMVALAASAHVMAGGALPHPVIFLGLVALVLAPVMILARSKVAAPAMAGLLVASQLILHEAFNALSMPAGFQHIAVGHLHGPGSVLPATAFTPDYAVPNTLMLVLHAAATLATAVVLARGEAAVWALAAWLRPTIRILTPVVIPDWPLQPARPAVVVLSRWRNLRLPARRGPPLVPTAP